VSSPVGGVADDEPSGDEADLLAANAAFYRAFEAADLDAMSDLWEHSDRVECVHPGWSALRGWGEVAASWATLFGGRQRLQFILTDARAVAVGDVGWVSVDENLLAGDVTGGSGTTGTVAAINVFVRRAGRWRMVAHHGAPVAGRAG
jgi:ketosteroid isomerase-like protein